MKLHNHVIMEPPRGKHVWSPRWFFHLHRGPEYGDGPILDGHLEFVLSKPTADFGISFEVGTRGSETPFDGHLKLFGTALYWGIKQGGQLATLITQRWFTSRRMAIECLEDRCDCPPKYPATNTSRIKRHPNGENQYEGRHIKIYTFENTLWWQFWTRKNGWSRGEFAEWRSGSLDLNPLNHLLGRPTYTYEDQDEHRILIDMPEAVYPVKAKLQRQTFGRPKGRKHTSWSVDVDAAESKGIPDCYDPSGGWKGDRVWGFGVKLASGYDDRPRQDWWVDAKAAIESRILATRARTGFRKPQPLDD